MSHINFGIEKLLEIINGIYWQIKNLKDFVSMVEIARNKLHFKNIVTKHSRFVS